jgi:toxin ParE1/3/4
VRVRWLRKALDNLPAEIEFVAQENPSAAVSLARESFEATDRLGKFPGMGRLGRVPGTRELVIPDTPYILPYRVRAGAVEILRVFHAARRWPEGF